MALRELHSPPRILPLYARTLAPLVPGASRLPWVGGGGGEIPDLELSLAHVQAERARVAEYARVCAFAPAQELPATFVHVLAFPLHLALMSDGRFPLAAVGLVHIANRIAQQRPIRLDEPLELRVRATPLLAHPRGRTFALISEARVDGELVWWECSTMLRRGPGSGSQRGEQAPALPFGADGERWRLGEDLGRRYAAVSGDRNPIHMHALSARALGFPRAIAHGMWTKARCLAALQQAGSAQLNGAFSVDVRFRRPILLPTTVAFTSAAAGTEIAFGVRDAATGSEHLDGRLRTLADISEAQEDEH